MKRSLLVIVTSALVAMAPAIAHEQKSAQDSRNPSHPLDLKRGYLDHSDTRLQLTIETYGGFTNDMLGRKGTFNAFFWKKNPGRNGYYGVAIFKNRYGLTAKVYKVSGDDKFYTVGYGSVSRPDPTQIEISVKRSLIEAQGDYIRWTFKSRWGEDWNDKGDCIKNCHLDRSPNRPWSAFYHDLTL